MELGRKKYWLLLFGLVIGIIFDILFYNKTLGVSYVIFIAIILLILFLSFKDFFKKLKNFAWIFVVPVLLLASTFFIYSNQVLRILNFLIVPVLIIILCSLVTDTNRADWSDIRFIGDIAKRIFVPLRFIHMPFLTLSRIADNSSKDSKKRVLPKIILGILISIPILAIILWLLSSADVVFKDFFINIPILKIFKHFLVIILVSVYGFCFLWSLFKAFMEKEDSHPDAYKYNRIKWKLFLDPVILLTVLILINVIYGIFSFIQFKYLFGGSSFILPSSFTYAEYARRGFAELVVVSVINFGILIFGITFVKNEGRRIIAAMRSFLTILVIFTFVLLISAFYRMLIYEQAYGFTYLRIFVQVFMIMLFFLFIMNIIYIWHTNLPIIKYYFIISLSIYIIMNFTNVDVIIAKNNINRYFNTGQIDMPYLKGLSYDAAPELQKLHQSIKSSAVLKEKQMIGEIEKYFQESKPELKNQKSWQSYNISKYRAEQIADTYVK